MNIEELKSILEKSIDFKLAESIADTMPDLSEEMKGCLMLVLCGVPNEPMQNHVKYGMFTLLDPLTQFIVCEVLGQGTPEGTKMSLHIAIENLKRVEDAIQVYENSLIILEDGQKN